MARWLVGIVLLVALAAVNVTAQTPPAKKPDESPRTSNSTPPSLPTKLDGTGLSSFPLTGKVWVTPEKYKELEDRYQKLLEQTQQLDRQLKKELQPPSSCKLSGRIDGDVAMLRAEFQFATAVPNAAVFLGLKNGFLVDEGQIDDGVPHLETVDDGFAVRVDQAGPHRLTLNVRTPLVVKRNVGAAANLERGFDLGLPGSAVTTLAIELPQSVKELKYNDASALPKSPGHWDVVVGSTKSLVVLWKEPMAAIAGVGVPSARAQVRVKLEDSGVEVSTELTLEDPKNLTREWQVTLPALSQIDREASGPSLSIAPVEGKPNSYSIRPNEPTSSVVIASKSNYSRPNAPQRLPIGPFLVQGQAIQGTILVQSAPNALRGQRLTYHRFGEIFQRDPPRPPGTPTVATIENLAQFQFWNVTSSSKGLSPAKASLELEWKSEKSPVEASAEHDIRMRREGGRWLIETESKFLIHGSNASIDAIDVQRPSTATSDWMWLAASPVTAFPASLRWPILPKERTSITSYYLDDDDSAPLESPTPVGALRSRLKFGRFLANESTLWARSRLTTSASDSSSFVDLPRLLGVVDRGAKVTVWTPSGQELLLGLSDGAGVVEPVHEKFQQSFDQMPASIPVSWRPSQRERQAHAIVDVFVRGGAAHVRETLRLPTAAWSSVGALGVANTGQIGLTLPTPGFAFLPLNTVKLSQDRSIAWIRLPAANKDHFDIQMEYDLSLPDAGDDAVFTLPMLWPEGATDRSAKLRVWAESGVAPALAAGLGDWKDRPLEAGDGKSGWPSLVAVGSGKSLTAKLTFEKSAGHRLPVLNAERSLIQVKIDEDGNQSYRSRFLVRKFSGSFVDVEFSVPFDQAQPRFRIAGKEIGGVKVIDAARNRVRVPLSPSVDAQPLVFEIEHQCPASSVEGRRFWQTPAMPPRVVGDVVFGVVRWQASLPGAQTPFVLGNASVDYDWRLSGWLMTPEPSVSSEELDAWIGAADASDSSSVRLAWWRSFVEPQRIYHFGRQFWLILCSTSVLAIGLLVLLTPVPRFVIGLMLLAAGAGFVALGLFHEYLLPVVFYGAQPGLVVLAVIVAVQWLLRERYRRQLVFMPTFSRVPQGSTLVRHAQRPRDPSTVDAPPAALPGSVKGAGK